MLTLKYLAVCCTSFSHFVSCLCLFLNFLNFDVQLNEDSVFVHQELSNKSNFAFLQVLGRARTCITYTSKLKDIK